MNSHILRKSNKFISDMHNNKDFETPKKCEKSMCNRSIYKVYYIIWIETMGNNMKILRYLAGPELIKEKIAKTLQTV